MDEGDTTHREFRQTALQRAKGVLPPNVMQLVSPYKGDVYWFEIFQTLRKLALIGVPVFFMQVDTGMQAVNNCNILYATTMTYSMQ